MNANRKKLHENALVRRVNAHLVPKLVFAFKDILHAKFNIDVDECCARYLVIALVSTALAAIPLFLARVSLPLLAIIAFGTFFLVHRLALSSITGIIQKNATSIEKFIPLLKLELKFLLTVFPRDVDILRIFIELLSSIDDPRMSKEFKEARLDMMLGSLPEDILSRVRTFSTEFNTFMTTCSNVDNIQRYCDEREDFSEYKVFMRTLESRIVILVAEGIFFPIAAVFLFMFQSLPVPLIIAFVAIHVVLLRLVARWLLKKRFSLIVYQEILIADKDTDIDKFLEFLEILARLLRRNSPEVAIARLLDEASSAVLQHLHVERNFLEALSFDEFLDNIVVHARSNLVRMIIGLVQQLRAYASDQFGTLLQSMIDELKEQKKLDKEKSEILKGERFKIYVLIACLPLILAILTGILPFLMVGEDIDVADPATNPMLMYFHSLTLVDWVYFLAFNLAFNYATAYYLTRISGIFTNHKFAIISTVIFLGMLFLVFGALSNGAIFDFGHIIPE
nr:hypothetical protein [Candidatus Sigynarchaeota archaeon]